MFERLPEMFPRSGLAVAGLSLAAFLALFWLLRGAPPGQAADESGGTDEAPAAGYRDRVVAAAVVGMVLIGLGAYLAAAVGIPWSLAPLAAGFGTLLVLVSTNRRHRHASPTLRRVVRSADLATTGTLMAGILIVGNVLAFKYGGRPIDFTSDRTYSLAPQTIRILEGLEKPIRFSVFLGAREPGLRVLQLLQLYQDANPGKVEVDDINPFRDLDRFQVLRDRVPGVVASEGGGGVAIEYGEGEQAEGVVVQAGEMFGASEGGGSRFETTFQGEDALTSALIRLIGGERTNVGITTGHGEPSGDTSDASEANLALFRGRLEADGSRLLDLNLLADPIPAETALIIVAAPRTPFQPEEVARLRTYLAGGGHLIAIIGNDGPTGLEDLLREYNVEVGAGHVVDPKQSVRGRPTLVGVQLGTVRHPIVDALRRRIAILPDAAPLTIVGESAPGTTAEAVRNPGVLDTAIVRTSPSSWAESDPRSPPLARDEGEPAGPLAVAVAATDRAADQAMTEPPGTPRLVVFGSRDMADTFWIQNAPANLDLLMNAVYWLRGRPELIGIAPKTHVALTFSADPRLRSRLILVPTLMALLTIVSLGVIIYLARRH